MPAEEYGYPCEGAGGGGAAGRRARVPLMKARAGWGLPAEVHGYPYRGAGGVGANGAWVPASGGGSPAIVTPNRCCRDDRRGAPDPGRDSSPAPTGAKTRTLISAPDNPSLMERDEALALLRRYVVSPSHIAHSYATAGIMKRVAEHLGEDAGTWEIIGLLHDIDYDLVAGDMDRHGIEGHRILIENGVPEEIADIVRRHNHTHFSDYVRPVEIALQAADSASGLIIACALVKGGAVSEVAPRTVKKKFKEKSFAAGCERERIRMIESLMDMETFFRLAIEGIMDIRTDIGLT